MGSGVFGGARRGLSAIVALLGKRLLVMGFMCLLGQFGLGGAAVLSEEGEGFLYDGKGRRDPFVGLVRDGRLVGAPRTRKLEPLKPVLYGILWDSDGKSIALINDVEVNVGDKVGGYRVEEIRPDAVVLAREGGRQIVLELAFDALESPKVSTP